MSSPEARTTNQLLPMVETSSQRMQHCRFKCASACHHDAPNERATDTFAAVLERAVTRRAFLGALASTSLVVALPAGAAAATRSLDRPGTDSAVDAPEPARRLTFQPIGLSTTDRIDIPEGYAWDVLVARCTVGRAPHRRRHRARRPWGVDRRDRRAGWPMATRDRRPQPTDHGHHPDAHQRAGRGRPTPAHGRRSDRDHGPGDAQQLRRRLDAVGHVPDGRGELQPVLRQRGDPGRRQGQVLARPLSHPGGRQRAQVGAGRRALGRGRRTERGVPARLGRRDRPVRSGLDPAQADGARPAEARGRPSHPGQRPSRGRVHGRRRALRVPLQVRLGRPLRPGRRTSRAQPGSARCRNAVRRPVR